MKMRGNCALYLTSRRLKHGSWKAKYLVKSYQYSFIVISICSENSRVCDTIKHTHRTLFLITTNKIVLNKARIFVSTKFSDIAILFLGILLQFITKSKLLNLSNLSLKVFKGKLA